MAADRAIVEPGTHCRLEGTIKLFLSKDKLMFMIYFKKKREGKRGRERERAVEGMGEM